MRANRRANQPRCHHGTANPTRETDHLLGKTSPSGFRKFDCNGYLSPSPDQARDLSLKARFVLECQGCVMTDDSLAEFEKDFTFESVDFPRLYEKANFVVSAFRGQDLAVARNTPEFQEALQRLLTHALVRSAEVVYRPHPRSGSRREKKVSLTVREVAMSCPPGPEQRRIRVHVRRLPKARSRAPPSRVRRHRRGCFLRRRG